MAQLKGEAAFRNKIRAARKKLDAILRGAARAGATVMKEEIAHQCESDLVKAALTLRTTADEGPIISTVYVKGRWAKSVANWLEYGTSAHFISVAGDPLAQPLAGQKVERVTKEDGSFSLVIGGRFVGKTVLHPGARPRAFMRTGQELSEREAIKAAQDHLDRAGVRRRR